MAQRHLASQEVADVLQLVVQHCPEASQIRTLCSLLQVSRTVQQAVQQAVGSCSLVLPCQRPNAGHMDKQNARLAACCSWLPKHAGLIRKLVIGHDACRGLSVSAASAAQHLMGLALQLCAVQTQAAASCWQLESLDVQWQTTPEFLHHLSACTSLTRLKWTFNSGDRYTPAPASTAALYAALGRLQTLLELIIYDEADDVVLGMSFAAGVSCLTRLQHLRLWPSLHPSAAGALPASLQALTVVSGDIEAEPRAPCPAMDLQHLGELHELHLQCNNHVEESWYDEYLDAQLEREDEVVAASGLQQLQVLHVDDGLASVALVKRLSLLQQLRELDIGLDELAREGSSSISRALCACLDGIAQATQLTKLLLSDRIAQDPPQPLSLHGVQLHGYLQQLTQLQHLDIASLDVQPEDAVHFTALKSLTALHMYNCLNIGDLAAAAMACHLPALRVLALVDCGLASPALWPSISMATGLKGLSIDTLLLDGAALGLLTKLTRLASLKGSSVVASVEDYERFRAAMPALVEAPNAPAG